MGRRPDATTINDITVQTFYVVFPPSTFESFSSLKADEISDEIIKAMIQKRLTTFEPYLRNKTGASVWDQATSDDAARVGARYLVNSAGGVSAGAKRIQVDTGSGNLQVGDLVTFDGSQEEYAVTERLAGSSGSLMIEPGLANSLADDTEIVQVSFQDRINAAKVSRLVEVLRSPVEEEIEPCVVGRESLAVEVVRLRDQGRDPRVIAQIYVSGSANVNPHTRESQRTKNVGRGDTICVIEGRAASVFFIGPNTYDDVQVEGMPPNEWYQLRVLSPDQLPVTITLAGSMGRPIPQLPETPPDTWKLGSQDQNGWSCTIEVMKHPNITISQVTGLPELPPSIKLIGRVLPNNFKPPEELETYLEKHNITCISGVRLERKIYLYASRDGNPYIVDLDGSGGLVVASQEILPNTYLMEERTSVTIGRLRYLWLTNNLPPEIMGRLVYERSEDCPAESMPVLDGNANRWVIGRQHKSDVMMRGTPLFSAASDDQYLSRNGNLVLRYSEPDGQGYPVFKLSLLGGGKLGLFVKPAATGLWESGPWPWPEGNVKQAEIPGVSFNGVSNGLIVGTSYFDIATRHTLRPIQ
jgi:hypothetical protein